MSSSQTALNRPSVQLGVTVLRGQVTPLPAPEEPTPTLKDWPMKHNVQPVILANIVMTRVRKSHCTNINIISLFEIEFQFEI